MYIKMASKIKSILFVFILLFLFGCDDNGVVGVDQNEYPYAYVEDNDCLPRAMIVREALINNGIWSEVVLYYFEEPDNTGHAVCVYVYKGRLWTYDSLGSYSIDVPKSLDDALFIARQAEERRRSKRKVRSAKFL